MFNGFRGGFGGGNMQNLLKEAQKMQEQMQKKQAEIEATTFTSAVGGGMVEVAMNGKYELVSLNIKREVVDPDDVEMLEDLVKSAVSSCLEKVSTAKKESMPNLPNGMGF
ncbi:MAG: YbaB/EbfC family nucleoid-associated protein [Clostridia bacterium]|nr:YbaB/EbfC family nucleoid-associated protein [Clostridia bacterium]